MPWPLAVPSLNCIDKLKACAWMLRSSHWTQGAEVRAYEQRWEEYTNSPHAIMVSSGSAANHLIALRRKYELEQAGQWPERNKVIFPAVTWVSSVSPWLQLGFEPVFMDVGGNLCSDWENVEAVITKPGVGTLFYTTLLGLTSPLEKILALCSTHQVAFLMDNCESSHSTLPNGNHFCALTTSSTSFYFSHHTSGDQEGGMIFCANDEEAVWYRMARNHGMTRGAPSHYHNPKCDPAFDFHLAGSNHRSTNLLAYLASLNFDRALAFAPERTHLSKIFTKSLDPELYELPHTHLNGAVPLALPILARDTNRTTINRVKGILRANAIEYRPIIGGNLLYHTAFGKYGWALDFPRATHIHNNGLYIGLHKGVTERMIARLTPLLNS